jgi:hypothetical protein
MPEAMPRAQIFEADFSCEINILGHFLTLAHVSSEDIDRRY